MPLIFSMMKKMQKASQKNKALSKAMSFVEVIVSMAIVIVVFAAVIPQLRAIRNSWAVARETAELVQTGQALMSHISTHLVKARRVMAVSDPCESNGYIEFSDNDDTIMRYQIGEDSYIQYGPIGDLSDLAGPVSALHFTCYDSCDLDTPISDVDYIRSIKVQATLPNPNTLGRDYTLTTLAYLRTNYMSERIIVGTEYLFDNFFCRTPVLAKVDDEHFLCAYEGSINKGRAVILIPRCISGAWQISKGSYFQFDMTKGQVPELCQIDATRYLCAYRGLNTDGWAVVLIVNTGSWTVSKYTNFEFANNTGLPPVDAGGPDADPAFRPALAKIDNTHYLCAYMGVGYDGWAVVLTINPSTYAISAGTPFEFDVAEGQGPALAQIDNTHYLCAYSGPGENGKAVVLEVDTGTLTITKNPSFIFDPVKGERPDLAKIDDEHFLCAYGGPDNDGWAVVLNVNTATWHITKNTAYEFDPVRGEMTKLQKVDYTNYVCSYEGDAGREKDFDYPASILLNISLVNWTICRKTPLMMYGDEEGDAPDIAVINDRTFISTYDGFPWKGNAVVLEVDLAIKP